MFNGKEMRQKREQLSVLKGEDTKRHKGTMKRERELTMERESYQWIQNQEGES